MGAMTAEKALSRLGEICAIEFLDSLSSDEKAIFQATDVAEALLQEVRDADKKHKEGSLSRKASSSVSAFIAGIMQYAPALDVFANSNRLLCPIWGSMRILLHVSIILMLITKHLISVQADSCLVCNRVWGIL